MATTGRPTKFDDLTVKRILEAIKRGNSRACAAGLVGVGVSTLHRWMADNREFRERVRAADAQAEQQVVSAMFALATDKTRPHFEAIKFWLKTRRAKTWREMQASPAPPPAAQDLTQASEEELAAAVEAWLAERKQRAGRRERAWSGDTFKQLLRSSRRPPSRLRSTPAPRRPPR